MVTDREFRSTTLAQCSEAVAAVYRSDATAYVGLLAEREPVSLFGALGPHEVGRTGVTKALEGVASRFGDPSMTTRYDVVELGSDLAYTVGFEEGRLSVDGVPRDVRVRVTHIYRLEDGDWRLVHRHGDFDPMLAVTS